jgi:hypothetical protein
VADICIRNYKLFNVVIIFGRTKGKRPLGRPRHRWEDNMNKALREIGIDEANWIHLAQDRVWWQAFVSTVINEP